MSAVLQWTRVCFGVDANDGKAVIVRAERHGKKVSFSTLSADDPAFLDSIKSGVPCVGSLTARESFVRWLEAPFSTFRKAEKVLPTLLDIELPFPLEECVCQFIPAAGVTAGKTRALAVAARLEDVQKKIQSLSKSGVDPVVLDHEGLAIWTRSLEEMPLQPGAADELRIIVFLRAEQATLVVGRGNDFVNTHTARISDTVQLRRVLKPYAKKDADASGTARWLWAGPGASRPEAVAGMYEELAKELPGTTKTHADPGTFLARAVAARALLDGPMRCNLRIGQTAHPVLVKRTQGDEMRAAVLALVAGIILCGSNLVAQAIAKSVESRSDQELARFAGELAGYQVVGQGNAAVRQAGDKVKVKLESLRPFVGVWEPSKLKTLEMITGVAKKNSVSFDSVTIGSGEVRIIGFSRSWTGCDELVKELTSTGYAPKLDRKDKGADGIVPFSISSGSEAP